MRFFKYRLETLTLLDLILTCPAAKVRVDDVIWSNNDSLSIYTCKMTQKTPVARHVCDFYFVLNPCDLTLTLLSMAFVLT